MQQQDSICCINSCYKWPSSALPYFSLRAAYVSIFWNTMPAPVVPPWAMMDRFHKWRIVPGLPALAAILVGSFLTGTATAQGSSETAVCWSIHDVDSGAEIVRHQRTTATFDEPAADRLTIHAGYGTQALAYFQIPRARVISELKVSVPIRADRIGLQALLRVVLPRTTDPKTGGPIIVHVPGTSCQTTTAWETLVVENITQQLVRKVRVLQLGCEAKIDVREAYVDMVLINVYGGAGATNVALGDPLVEGSAAIPQHGLDGTAIHSVSYRSRDDTQVSAAVRKGDILHVRGRPLFVRMVDDNGEDWSLLKSLGINTVRLAVPVTFQQLAAARKLGLWIVSPPPRTQLGNGLSQHFDRVIAWDLGEALTGADLPATRATARRLRDAQPEGALPIACGATCELSAFGSCAEILIHRRTIPTCSLENPQYARWLQRRIESSRPTSVHWAAIETQPATATIEQALAFGWQGTPRLEVNEIRGPAFTAAATGARGIYFRSRSPLDRTNPDDQLRQLAIRRINLELQLIEPWLAAGRLQRGAIEGASPAPSAIRTDMSTLFFLRRDATQTNRLRWIIPDASETMGVYRIGAGGLIPMSHRRVAGGTEIVTGNSTAAHLPESALVLVTRDEAIVRAVARRINRNASAIADVIRQQLATEMDAEIRLGSIDDTARKSHQSFQAALAQGDLAAAHEIGESLLQRLEHGRHRDWQTASRSLSGPTACALATHANTREALRSFLSALPRIGQSLNLLDGGGCDEMSAMVRAGWQTSVDQNRAAAQVAITGDQPRAGQGCLQITAAWSESAGEQITDDQAIVWTSAPPVTIGTGQVVRIDGWVKFDRSLDRSGENAGQLVIFDSLTGPALGLRWTQTTAGMWQPFTIYRAASDSTELTLSFALTGPGTAHIDEVSIAPILSLERE